MNVITVFCWLLAWTTLGSGVLLLTALLTPRVCYASVRHLAWATAFVSISLLPLGQITAPRNNVPAGGSICPPVLPETNVLAQGLCGVWMGGTGWMLIRVVLARRVVSHWRKCSQPYHKEPWTDQFANTEVRIARESNPLVPITWGVFRPVVLLPQAAWGWDQSRMAAVLWHEFGHIRRFDALTQRWALVLCAIHWFNPVFWIAARQMEAEAEIAADDFAILRGVKPSSYARELLGIAAQLSSGARKVPFGQTAMVKSLTLEGRVRSIIDPNSRRGGVSLRSRARIAGMFAAATLVLMISMSRLAKSIEPRATATAHCLVPENAPKGER